MKKTLGFLTLLTLFTPVALGEVATVTSVGNGPYYDGLCSNTDACVLVKVTPHTFASCANAGLGWSYAFDASTHSGQATLSILLTALSTKKEVNISGTGTCSIYGPVEDLKLVYFE